ncbi:carbonic anhydrase 7 isoform X2 [Prinia subflava]|uniref:carbonic anhydrase 7 isoform X2 n=1 Tax=Prinia subflava TaxID=208062 RepID=UPI002FE21E31
MEKTPRLAEIEEEWPFGLNFSSIMLAIDGPWTLLSINKTVFGWMHFGSKPKTLWPILGTLGPRAISGGPFQNPFRLKQFHFHWGTTHSQGSEHTIDGKPFPCELHLVHWNARKYATFGEAAAAPDGLAVVGVFLEIGKEHASMNRLTDALYMVKFKGTKAQFRGFNPKCLLPLSLDYWTYLGSLTTPPLNESVTWIVLKEPIRISVKQLEKFHMLLFTGEEDQRIQMANNFRPPQPLKGRIVRASFKA